MSKFAETDKGTTGSADAEEPEHEPDTAEEDGIVPDTRVTGVKLKISQISSDEELVEGVERETWGSKLSYILTLVGYAVGFGNIWRFPYLLQENGGIVFMIPYTMSVFLVGIPIFYLELAVGQRLRKGPIGCWHEVSPYLGGVGVTTGLTCTFVALYYNTLVAWVISYIMDCFARPLRYSGCDTAVASAQGNASCDSNSSLYAAECSICERAGASQYYWNRRVLNISTSISDSGDFNYWILICLVLAWAAVYVVLVKGIKAAGKVVYFTAVFPYFVLLIFFIRGLLLENMSNGYYVLFTPQWEKLADANVWRLAASQIFFSLGIGYGCLIAFASYLKPNNDCHSDAMLIALINCSTSFFATLTMFPFLGYYGTQEFENCKVERQVMLRMALGFEPSDLVTFPDSGGINYYSKDGNDYLLSLPSNFDLEAIRDCTLAGSIRATASGTGFVFIVFAQAMATLRGSQFWAFLFFTMLFTLGIDSAFGTIEGALASIVDLQFKVKKWVITTIFCSILSLVSLMFSWGWGQYILTFMDDYCANWPLVLVGFVECIGIGWVYGLQRFARDLALMTGKRPGIYWLLCWKFISPIFVLAILLSTLVDLRNGVNYSVWSNSQGGLISVPYPTYAVVLGFMLTIFIIMWIPLIALLRRCGINLIKDEVSADFPEEELKIERNYQEADEIPKDSVTKFVLWGSLQNPNESGTGIGSRPPSPRTGSELEEKMEAGMKSKQI